MDPITQQTVLAAAGAGSKTFGDPGDNGTVHSSGGIIVLNGYGLLYYIGSSGSYNTWGDYPDDVDRTYTLSDFAGIDLDIEMVGGGGSNTSGGSGGGGGAAGVRLVYAPTGDLTLIIGGGMNTHFKSTSYGDGPGRAPSNTKIKQGSNTIAYAEGGGGSSTSTATFSCANNLLVEASEGLNKNAQGGSISTGQQYSFITGIDTNHEPSRGGNGERLQGFSGGNSNEGKGLGGGGGGQNSVNYGGSSNGRQGGRYGYAGSTRNPNSNGTGYLSNSAQAGYTYAYGPSPGENNSHRYVSGGGSYRNAGGGGSFGGGGADDGSGPQGYGHGGSGGGGAILIRIDTTQFGFAVSGRPGWPTSNGPWTG